MGRKEYVSSSKTTSTLFGKEKLSVGERKLLLASVRYPLKIWAFFFPPSTSKFSGTELEDHMGPEK